MILNPNAVPLLVVTKERSQQQLLQDELFADGYRLYFSRDAESAIELANEMHPHLVILDEHISGTDAYTLCRRLRDSLRFGSVPIIILTDEGSAQIKSSVYAAGADDQVTKPFNPVELNQRVETLLERTKHYVHANPLTGLPGNPEIEFEIRRKILNQDSFAVAYIDIDYFKSYNDSYGWLAGDNVIRRTSGIILDVFEKICNGKCFIGHLGGDDFIAIMPPELAEKTAQELISQFDSQIPEVYPPNDRQRGYIIHHDRQGNLYCFPLLSISIAICSNRHHELIHPGQVAQIGLELKEHIKSKLGSNYIIDRRKTSS